MPAHWREVQPGRLPFRCPPLRLCLACGRCYPCRQWLDDVGDETQVRVGAVDPCLAQRTPGYALPGGGQLRRNRLSLRQPVAAGYARGVACLIISALRLTQSTVRAGESVTTRFSHSVRVCTQEVGKRGAHAQDQDGQAGDCGGDAPRRVGGPGLGEQVVGDLVAAKKAGRSAAHDAAARRAIERDERAIPRWVAEDWP